MPLNIDWQQILLHLFNFCILAIALYFLLYKPIKKYMAKRDAYYDEQAKNAKDRLDEAEKLKNDYAARLSDADREIEKKRSDVLHEAAEYREKRIGEAEAEAEAMIEKAKRDAKRERDKIIDGAGKEIADMVGAAAEKLVFDSTDAAYEALLSTAEKAAEDAENDEDK